MNRPQYSVSPLAVFPSFWNHRQLIWQMTKREVVGCLGAAIMEPTWRFFNRNLVFLVNVRSAHQSER